MKIAYYPDALMFPHADHPQQPQALIVSRRGIRLVPTTGEPLPRERWVQQALVGLMRIPYPAMAHVSFDSGRFHVQITSLPEGWHDDEIPVVVREEKPTVTLLWKGTNGATSQLDKPRALVDQKPPRLWWKDFFEERLWESKKRATNEFARAERDYYTALHRVQLFDSILSQ